jgi:hypothetical protein
VDRDSGTDSAIGGWLQRLVRPHGHKLTLGILLRNLDVWRADALERACGEKIGVTGLNIHLYLRVNIIESCLLFCGTGN